jgi:hypothetical protein
MGRVMLAQVQKPVALLGAMLSGGVLGVAGEVASLDGPKVIGTAVFIGMGSVFVLWKIVSWWLDSVTRAWNQMPLRFEGLDEKIDKLAEGLRVHMAQQHEIRRAREERDREVDRRLSAIEMRCQAYQLPPRHGG